MVHSSFLHLYCFVILISLIKLARPHPSPHQTIYSSNFTFPPAKRSSLVYLPLQLRESKQITNHTAAPVGFVDSYPGTRTILQINGTVDDSIILTSMLEPHLDPSNYTFVFISNDTNILQTESDLSTTRIDSQDAINVTIAADFQRFPGPFELQVEARRTSDYSLFDVYHINFLVAGIAVYVKQTNTLISGLGRSFTIPSFQDTTTNAHREFAVFTQFIDGSNSNSDTLLQSKQPPGSGANAVTFDTIVPSFMSYSGQILWDTSSCSINGAEWSVNRVNLKQGCGMGFAPAFKDGVYDGYRLAYDFQPNRAGTIGVLFTWNGFTDNSQLDEEEHTNYVIIRIGGQPPSIVRKIEPANPFSKDGGEELYVEFINTADVNITSFNVNGVPFEIVGGSRKIVNGPDDFYESAKFRTKPGTGKRLPWTVTATRINPTASDEPVQFIDETGFLFSYDDQNVVLREMQPPFVPEDGQVQLKLIGDFPGFNAQEELHNVYIGNELVVEKKSFLSSSDTEIILIVPPRLQIGVSWRYSVYIQIDQTFSNELYLEYYPLSLNLRGAVFGASFDGDSNTYTLNSCGESTFIVTISDQPESINVTYDWQLVDAQNVNYLANATSIVKDMDTLVLPNELVPRFNEPFQVIATATLQNLTGTYIFNVSKADQDVIGVTLIRPENRTVSSPMVNLRLIAKVDLPACASMPDELTYEWELENRTKSIRAAATTSRTIRKPLATDEEVLSPVFDNYIFSYANRSVTSENDVTPTRLGRELIVPIERIQNGFQHVRLTVYGKDPQKNNTFIRGHDRTSFTIFKSPLVAVIGTGQLSRRVSDAETLVMSAQGSYDPDLVSSSDKSKDLYYEWACHFSVYANMSNMVACPGDLLPDESSSDKSKFEIIEDVLSMATNETIEGRNGNIYLRYQVTITKDDERTSSATQQLTVARTSGTLISRYFRIEVLNSRDEVVNGDAIEFWDDVVIRPIAPTSTQWRFRLELPTRERSTFFTPSSGKLIPTAGYYAVTGQTAATFQQVPLGVLADGLQPKQTYQFLISFQEAGRLNDDVQLQLKTVEVPELIFPPLAQVNGSLSTIFTAVASTSFNGLSKFTYQFYLLEMGMSSREYCVDGCTGANLVRFQVPAVGFYTLQCRLLAANGKRLLAVKNNTNIISIYPPMSTETSLSGTSRQAVQVNESQGSALSTQNEQMEREFKLGNDGWVVQKAFFASDSLYKYDDVSGGLRSNVDAFSMCENYTSRWLDYALHIVSNEQPNTQNARNYVSYASNFARLSCVETEDSLMKLLQIVDRSITQTPAEEVLTTATNRASINLPNVELQEELRRFYNFSYAKAVQIMSKNLARNKLAPQPGTVHNLILDVAEQSIKHLTAAATSGRVCGWEKLYTFDTSDGVSPVANAGSTLSLQVDASSSSRKASTSKQARQQDTDVNVIKSTSVHVAVKCNPEQGMSLTTPHTSFEWCDTVYSVAGDSRKLVTLAETFDYPYLSGVQGANQSDTERIVFVDITTLGAHNRLEQAVSSESLVAAQDVIIGGKKLDQVSGARDGRSSSTEDPSTCYKVGMKMAPAVKSSSLPAHVRDKLASCWVNQPFRMAPQKPFGYTVTIPFEGDMYMRRMGGVTSSSATTNSSLNVTALTNDLGLFGAARGMCSNSLHGQGSSQSFILTGFLLGILLIIIIVTAIVYVVITALTAAAARSEDGEDEDGEGMEAFTMGYMDRDFYGRKEVTLEMDSEDVSISRQASEQISRHESYFEDLEMEGVAPHVDVSRPEYPKLEPVVNAEEQEEPTQIDEDAAVTVIEDTPQEEEAGIEAQVVDVESMAASSGDHDGAGQGEQQAPQADSGSA